MLATVAEMMAIDPQTSLECWREVKYSHASDHDCANEARAAAVTLLWLDWAMLARLCK